MASKVKRLKFNSEKCIGCQLCMQACSGVHEGEFKPSYARLKIESYYDKGELKFDPRTCILCGICVKACPFDAISMEDGRIVLHEEKCKNCGICVEKCPKNVIVKKENTVAICDLCGGDPTCVKFCPHGALSYE